MDIADLISAGHQAGEFNDMVAVPAGLEQAAQDFIDRSDPLGAGVTPEERQAMLERNFPELVTQAAPAAPIIAPTPAPAPIAVAPAPIVPQFQPQPVGPSPEALALMELAKTLKDEIVESRKPPTKTYEQMDPVERLQHDLIEAASKTQSAQLAGVQAELKAMRDEANAAKQEAKDIAAAHEFQGQVAQNIQASLLRSEIIDPEFVTTELRDDMTELGLTAAAGWREDAQKATARVARMIQGYNNAIQKTQAKRVAPQVSRTAALPVPVPTGQPAVGLPRRVATNADVQKYYGGDRFKASMEGYRKIPASAG